jgi:hypothetical protein
MSAIEANHWLVSWSRDKAQKIMSESRERDLLASIDYWSNQIRRLESAMESPALLKGVGAPFVSSTSGAVERLLSFRNAPSQDTWEPLARTMILPNGTTAWQLWCQNDSDAPLSLPTEGRFEAYPDPDDFFAWIGASAMGALTQSRERLEEAQTELKRLKAWQ